MFQLHITFETCSLLGCKPWRILSTCDDFKSSIRPIQQIYYENTIVEAEIELNGTAGHGNFDPRKIMDLIRNKWNAESPMIELLQSRSCGCKFKFPGDKLPLKIFSFGFFESLKTYVETFTENELSNINITFPEDNCKFCIGYKSSGKKFEIRIDYDSLFVHTKEKTNLKMCTSSWKYPPSFGLKENQMYKRHIKPELSACNAIKLTVSIRQMLWALSCALQEKTICSVKFAFISDKIMKPAKFPIPPKSALPFSIAYLIQALLCRGFATAYQLDDIFMEQLKTAYHTNKYAVEKTLEQIILGFDEHRQITLLSAFTRIFDKFKEIADDEDDVPQKFVKVRRLVITPSRRLLMPAEILKSNRILRQFGEDFALMVLFRDENGRKLPTFALGKETVKNLVESVLLRGFQCGKRRYEFLAWSNSQFRDNGCYMYCRTDKGETVADIRQWMGDFSKIKTVPKLMARMGQCFTQSEDTFTIGIAKCSDLPDIYDGSNNPNAEDRMYNFSDGIGKKA